MSDVGRNLAAQVEVYGEPLADVFGRLTEGLGLSQAQLARTLGMSPPMLSQLGSGHRVKIGNPAVLRRLEALQLVLEEVLAGRLDDAGLAERLDTIREATHAWTTTSLDLAGGSVPGTAAAGANGAAADVDRDAVEAATVRGLLRAVASGAQLRSAADLLEAEHPTLAELVRTYGLGSPDEAAAHLRRHRDLI